MRKLTAEELLDLKFGLSVKETNEVYEDTMTDIEHGTQYVYAADGYCVYNTSCGIVISFNWMSSSNWVEKGEEFNYSTFLHCHDPEFRIFNAELINDDGSLMDDCEIHNTLMLLVEHNISFEQVIEKDLPLAACGE